MNVVFLVSLELVCHVRHSTNREIMLRLRGVKGISRIRNDSVALLAMGFYLDLVRRMSGVAISRVGRPSFTWNSRFLDFILYLAMFGKGRIPLFRGRSRDRSYSSEHVRYYIRPALVSWNYAARAYWRAWLSCFSVLDASFTFLYLHQGRGHARTAYRSLS